jgi:methionyl-tRNA formyltransferase
MTGSPTGETAAAVPVRTMFFGSGGFAVPILDALLGHELIDVAGVVTAPDRPAGRGRALGAVPVATFARSRELPMLQPRSLRDPDSVAVIAAWEPGLGVLADYGRIVPPAVLDLPAHAFLNVHPSLLPRHRGAAPIAGAILAGDPETGVTIIRMDAGLDTGPIVGVERWPLAGTETAADVEARAAAVAADLLFATLPGWLAGRIEPRSQPGAGATLTRPLRREDGRLDGHEPAELAERRLRALAPWPGTFIETDDGRVAVLRATATPPHPGDAPGTLVADGEGIALATVEGRLRLDEVRPAGGRPMTGEAWRRGRRSLAGSTVRAGAPPTAVAEP